MLFTNKIGFLIDLLIHQLEVSAHPPIQLRSFHSTPDVIFHSVQLLEPRISAHAASSSPSLPHDPLASALMQLLASILTCLAKNAQTLAAEKNSQNSEALLSRTNDVIRYNILSWNPFLWCDYHFLL